jgi:hypothetical protein
MKRFISLCLLISLLLCLVAACDSPEEEVIQSPTPVGQLSAEEAESILYDYLASQIRTMTDNLRRLTFSDYLFRTKSRWEVHDKELQQSYWEITGMGSDGLQLNESGLWRVYDVTGNVEPQNSDAQKLMLLIQAK